MNIYVRMINDAVDYIEGHLREPISLQTVADHLHMSAFHFNRIFHTVTGQTLKQYILGRKLSATLDALADGGKVIDIALEYGFTYPEVYSRAFKKQFGLPPHACHQSRPTTGVVSRAQIVERTLAHHQGRIALTGETMMQPALTLWGELLTVTPDSEVFPEQASSVSNALVARAAAMPALDGSRFYNVVRCLAGENGEYALFMGFTAQPGQVPEGLSSFIVPGGSYMRFQYVGDMFGIRGTFEEDLYRFVMVRELALRDCAVGMLCVFKPDYAQTRAVEIIVPVMEL